MTLKMIAIGILALMGLSSIMSPKTFRRFMGGFGALCMALFVGFIATGDHSKEGPTMLGSLFARVQKVAGLRPELWLESATERSQRIVNDVRRGQLGEPQLKDLMPNAQNATPRPKQDLKKRLVLMSPNPITVNPNLSAEEQRAKTVEGIQTRIDDYLVAYRSHRSDIGVDKINHRNLDPELLRWGAKKHKDGSLMVYLFADETYAEHVREQGRKLVIKERLLSMAYIGVVCVAFLLLSFGILKTLNRRAEPVHDQDYLKNSNISMV